MLAEVSQTVDEVVVIHRGRLRANSTLAELISRRGGGALVRVTSPEAERLADLLRAAGAAVEPGDDGPPHRPRGHTATQVEELAAENSVVLHELLGAEESSLEDVFLELTREGGSEEGGGAA